MTRKSDSGSPPRIELKEEELQRVIQASLKAGWFSQMVDEFEMILAERLAESVGVDIASVIERALEKPIGILKYALDIRKYGEEAGDWGEFDRRAKAYLHDMEGS